MGCKMYIFLGNTRRRGFLPQTGNCDSNTTFSATLVSEVGDALMMSVGV